MPWNGKYESNLHLQDAHPGFDWIDPIWSRVSRAPGSRSGSVMEGCQSVISSINLRPRSSQFLNPIFPHLLEIHGLPFCLFQFPWKRNSLLSPPTRSQLFLTVKTLSQVTAGIWKMRWRLYSHPALPRTPSFYSCWGRRHFWQILLSRAFCFASWS